MILNALSRDDTKRQARAEAAMKYIEWFIGMNGHPPTVREILKYSGGFRHKNEVQRILDYLEKEGYIKRPDKEKPIIEGRKIRLTRKRFFVE